MDSRHTTEYNNLVAQAEQASSHKEARHLINQATELMNTPKTTKPCRFSDAELQEWIAVHHTKIKNNMAQVNVSRQMIQMMEDIIESRTEKKGA
jgi:translation initiation factor 2B subunit (eIF-2B alpha/beta/delta family)